MVDLCTVVSFQTWVQGTGPSPGTQAPEAMARHIVIEWKTQLFCLHSGECGLSDCGNLNFLTFCVTEISSPKCVGVTSLTQHMELGSLLMSVFLALGRRNGLNNPHGPTVEKIFVLVLWSAFLIKTWTFFEGKGDPHCVHLIRLGLTNQLFWGETLCPRGL